MLIDENPTAENLAKLIAEYGLEQGFPVVEVRLWETPRCSATYRVPGTGTLRETAVSTETERSLNTLLEKESQK